MVDQIRFFAAAARLLEGRSAGEYMRGHTSYIRREPVGVCAAVTPWNYPMMMAVWKWAPALAAGNTMVLKPSDTTPVTTVMLAEILAEHLPPGVFNVVCGDRETGRALVEHPIPAMVSITGSVRAGMEVAASAAPGPQAGASRARWKGPRDRVRRRRPVARSRDDRRRRLLQRRSGLHRRHTCRCSARCLRLFGGTARRRCKRHVCRWSRRRRGGLRAPQQRRAARARDRLLGSGTG